MGITSPHPSSPTAALAEGGEEKAAAGEGQDVPESDLGIDCLLWPPMDHKRVTLPVLGLTWGASATAGASGRRGRQPAPGGATAGRSPTPASASAAAPRPGVQTRLLCPGPGLTIGHLSALAEHKDRGSRWKLVKVRRGSGGEKARKGPGGEGQTEKPRGSRGNSNDGRPGQSGAGHGRRAQGGAGTPVAMGPALARAGPLAAAGTPPAEAAEPAPGR